MRLEYARRLRWLAARPVAAEAMGQWCVLQAQGTVDPAKAVAFLAFRMADGSDQWIYLDKARRALSGGFQWSGFGHLPADASEYRIGILQLPVDQGGVLEAQVKPVSRPVAALWLLRRHWSLVLGRLARGDIAVMREWRSTLERLALRAALPGYPRWMRLFDHWAPGEIPRAIKPDLGILVFSRGPSAALAATLQSIEAQRLPVAHAVAGADWRAALATLPARQIALVQAGEVLPPQATELLAHHLARHGGAPMACAEEDALGADGERQAPHFKPTPRRTLMLSGTQTRGLWLARRDLLDAPALDGSCAETLRLDLWLRGLERNEAPAARIPYILTHRRPDTEAAEPAALCAVAQGHLDRAGLPWRAEAGPAPTLPITLRPAAVAPRPRVSLLVCSALRSPHVPRCLGAVLAGTDYPDFEIILGVEQPGLLDDGQAAMAAALQADPRLRVVHLPAPRFNYSSVNNRMAAMASGSLLCLLNDDVSPIAPDWLARMVTFLADPQVAVVGPRLLYPDGSVQHGGVLMGMNGLCNHFSRHLPGDAPGYHGRAILPQDLSAVTGACMLVRRSVYEALGGLDLGYPSAFNDVDFCLRVREAGFGVIYDGATSLYHFEGKTFVNHYSGERLAFRELEMARMRQRWADVIEADPFHSPNLRLEAEMEWMPAYPPRLALL